MATVFDFTQAQGLFKRKYADKVADLTPEHIYVMKEAKPIPPGPGESYQQAVVLANEQGFTLAAPDTASAFSLYSPSAGYVQQASVKGYQFMGRATLSVEAISRSQSNEQAFIAATKHVVKNILRTGYNMMEATALWGQNNIGVIESVSSPSVVITDASFASGLWFGNKGLVVGVYTAAGALRGEATISAVTIRTRTITFDALPAGTVATDVITYRGGTSAQMLGLYQIMTTTSGSLFGIDNTNYELWRSDTAYSAGSAALTFAKLLEAIAEAGELGLGDEIGEIDVLVAPRTWNSLNTDAAALRRSDASYKGSKFENGHEVLELFSNVGVIRIISHRMMKNGFAFILPKCSKSLVRVGSQSVPTFAVPGFTRQGEEYLKPMENSAGVEMRLYWNTQVFTEYVPHLKLINNIVNP